MRFFAVIAFALLSLVARADFGTDIDRAFANAKKSGKPMILDFYGIWCPPCNELDETVFETPAFAEKAKKFELLKVDADAPTSWKVKDRYKVGGYPTIVFTSSAGDEIYRIVGYRPAKDFLATMDIVLAAKKEPITKSCKSNDVDALWRCALVCTERKDNACAEKAYKKLETKLKPATVRYQLARGYFVSNSPTADLKRDGYERLLAEFADSPQSLLWSIEYLGLPDAKKKDLVEKVLTHFDAMMSDPRREEIGLSPTDMLEAKAELLEALGKTEEAKAAWKVAAAGLEKAAADLGGGKPERGFTIERIGALQSAGDNEGALKLANEYREKFPQEFTFHFWAARVLEGQKKYADAIPPARRAYELSYGDNRIRVATLLLQLLVTVPDKAGAKKVYDEVKGEIKPDTKLEVRTHRYLKKLDEAWQKFTTT